MVRSNNQTTWELSSTTKIFTLSGRNVVLKTILFLFLLIEKYGCVPHMFYGVIQDKMVSHVCFYQLINQSVQETLVINADKTQDYGSFK